MALIYHPVLDSTVEVPARTVKIWQRSGWLPVEHKANTSPTPVDEDPSNAEDTPHPFTEED